MDLSTASSTATGNLDVQLSPSAFFAAMSLPECTMINSWPNKSRPDAGLCTCFPKSKEPSLHEHPHPIRSMEGPEQDIAGATRLLVRPLPRRTVLSLSRTERSPLRRCARLRRRTRLDC